MKTNILVCFFGKSETFSFITKCKKKMLVPRMGQHISVLVPLTTFMPLNVGKHSCQLE